MENYQKYLNPQTLASLEGLDLQARLVVEGYVAGMHTSPYHGFSVEFAEHREYVAGRRHPPRRLEGLVQDRQVSTSSSTRRRRTSWRTCCWIPASRWATPRSGNVTEAPVRPVRRRVAGVTWSSSSRTRWVWRRSTTRVQRYLRPSGQPSHLKELFHVMDTQPGAARRRTWGRSFTIWPNGSSSAAIVVDPLRLFRRRPARSWPA